MSLVSKSRVWLGEMRGKLGRVKQLDANADMMETPLNRCLSTVDITLLGIGHMVGSGVYVLTSSVAKNIAGPAIVVSFIISGFASLLSALCYSEFSVRFPRAGSAYSYTYLALGEFWAFIVGWNMVLENVIGTAAVSRACSAYVDSLLDGAIRNYTLGAVSSSMGLNSLDQHIDFFSCLIVILLAVFLTGGIRVTSYVTNLFSVINIIVICFIIIIGFYFADFSNWSASHVPGGFMPYGWKGVFAASASCFYAYVGFDSIATSGEEAKDPQKSIPTATFLSMAFATLAYVGVSSVLTLMVPYNQIADESGLPDAFGVHGVHWAKLIVIVGAVCGMVTVLIGTMYSLTRIVYAMSEDGLLYEWMGKVNEKTQIPLKGMYFFSVIAGLMALTLDITTLVEMMSIGTLMAYLVVSASVIIVRYQPMEQVHESLSADIQGELNDLSAESPVNNEDQNAEAGTGTRTDRTQSCDSETGSHKISMSFLYRVIQSRLVTPRWVGQVRAKLPHSSVNNSVFAMVVAIFGLSLTIPECFESNHTGLITILVLVLLTILIGGFCVISMHDQNTTPLKYKVPFVPLIPTMSLICNIALMTNLNVLTWIRLFVWMIAGFGIYFAYGLLNSRLNLSPDSLSASLQKGGKNSRNWGSIDSGNLPDNESLSSAY